MGGDSKVPIIDLNDSDEGVLLQKIVKAFEEWGCFRLINHGIPVSLMAEMKIVSKTLLDLPLEIKLRNSNLIQGRGYTPLNLCTPFYEGLGVYDVASNDAVDEFCDQIHASKYQRDIITSYSRALFDVAQNMGRKLMKGMGLDGELYEGWPCQFRLNKYNYSSESVGKTGAVMHTDPGFLTVLQDDEIIGGLEIVSKQTGELVSMDPIPGSLVVNVGDIAKVWSNGRLNNVEHRVQCYNDSARISIVIFVLGPKDSKVESPEEFIDTEHPRMYVPFNFDDYKDVRTTTKSPSGGALELFTVAKSLP